MKKWSLLIMIALIMNSYDSVIAKTLIHPTIPEDNPTAEKIAIVLLQKKESEQEIKRLLKTFPDLQLRYIFEHALNGFSVKGPLTSIEKLAQTKKVLTVNPVNTYKAEKEENVRIIGGELVRGMFDRNDQRLTGKGVKVGVIDTGIDYTHPDLKNNYFGGYDLVDKDKDPMETKGHELGDTLHGTHVAGIIASNGRIQGVAPEAKIIAYRALGPGGSGTTEQVLKAIDKAIKDRVDILNLSLGNDINGPDLPISMAINKAVEKGITAVASSGNSGPNLWTVGSPGTASRAISVGATTPPMKVPKLKVERISNELILQPMHLAQNWDLDRSYQLAYGGKGKNHELKNIKGKIVLIERGEITFTEKAMNAYYAGAKAVLIYNNTNGSFIGNLEKKVDIPVAGMSKKEGELLKKAIQINQPFARTKYIETQDQLADFSSRGPVTSTWEIKPDVVAPGVAINSTVPGGYLALQGTSMAAPHVAGACALIKQAHPNWKPDEIKAALMNTALPIVNENGKPYRTYEQGAGRIQVDQAIQTDSIVMPASLMFGKFQLNDHMHEHFAKITIKNVGRKTISYSFSTPSSENGIQWTLPLLFRLKAGEERKVKVSMKVDPSAFKKKVHDGHLQIQAGSQTIVLPYLYVLEEPNYPRVMGFELEPGDRAETYRYEVYLPQGAEEFGIALFDPNSYHYVGYLEWKKDIGKGLLKQELDWGQIPFEGIFLAKVFAKKAGREDYIETVIDLTKGNNLDNKEEKDIK